MHALPASGSGPEPSSATSDPDHPQGDHPVATRSLRRLQRRLVRRVESASCDAERRAYETALEDLEHAAAAYRRDVRTWEAVRQAVRDEIAVARDLGW